MIGTAHGAVLEGIEATTVRVEVDVCSGIPLFSIVGLPDSAVSESKLRIRSAIRNAGLQLPSQRITVNLSPASLRKRGAGLDLAIAIAILRASGQLPPEPVEPPLVRPLAVPMGGVHKLGFCAELGLGGQLEPIAGVINLALALRKSGFDGVAIGDPQASTCIALPDLHWYAFPDLQSVVHALRNPTHELTPVRALHAPLQQSSDPSTRLDFAEVQGLTQVKRALTLAATGGHHALLVGPPGCGKTMVAERFCGILPALLDDDALEVYAIHQAAGLTTPPSRIPPLRSPHHSVTVAGLIGGGVPPMPGEASLAHRGVLLLDEMPEFSRHVLDALREPIVTRTVRIARGGHTAVLPAHFQLLATMNPCPCGKRGFGDCRCTDAEVLRYWSRLSGPLLDRIDLLIHVHPSTWQSEEPAAAKSKDIQLQVIAARARLPQPRSDFASSARAPQIPEAHGVEPAATQLIVQSARVLKLSQRATVSVRNVAQTIQSLAGDPYVTVDHVREALALRAPAPVSMSFH